MLALTQGLMSVASSAGDPNFANVVSLLHFDGVDGSTTFTDVKGRTWTRTGSAQIDTDQSRFGGASLLVAPGDSIETAASADFAFGTGDFTIEFFARRRVAGTNNYDWCTFGPNWDIYTSPDGTLLLWNGSGNLLVSSANVVTVGAWHHIAVTRASGTVRMFVDGVQRGGSSTGNTANFTSSQGVFVGYYPPNLRRLDGWVDEFRVTSGVARYTANFTAPSAPFPDF